MGLIKRFSGILNGGVIFTGNTLGLSKAPNANAPGTQGSIGTFICLDPAQKDGGFPWGTTGDWRKNGSKAVLNLPSDSEVVYAELIWGGSYRYGGEDVTNYLDNPVLFYTPAGVFEVAPDITTAQTYTSPFYFYVRSARVTDLVKLPGNYAAGRIPATQGYLENHRNHAGWTLAVIYQNPATAAKTIHLWVGGELPGNLIYLNGFHPPHPVNIMGKLFVSAQEGDANLTGDQLLYGANPNNLLPLSGPNNPADNFFASQINDSNGFLDTSGSFGFENHVPGKNGVAKRQGWDITSIDLAERLLPAQTEIYLKGTTETDGYLINALALQINVSTPVKKQPLKLSRYDLHIPSFGQPDFFLQYDYEFYLPYENRTVIHGIVRNPEGYPVPGAVVKFFKKGDCENLQPIGHVITDDCGQFIFGPVEDGITLLLKVFKQKFDSLQGTAKPKK